MVKHYAHVGTQPLDIRQVDGYVHVEPGAEFDADLTPELETYLTRIGAIVEPATGGMVAAPGTSPLVAAVLGVSSADAAPMEGDVPQAQSLRGKTPRRPLQMPEAVEETPAAETTSDATAPVKPSAAKK